MSTASLNGVVRDPSGAAIPNAKVVLRNIQTSVEHTTVSNSAGVYSIFSIIPGDYTVETTAPGFRPKEVPEFTLAVSQIATINFSLVVGSQNSTVTVQGANPQLQVSSASLGTVISAKQVNDLPLNGRNFTELLILTPGVSPVTTGQNAGEGWLSSAAIGSTQLFPDVNGQSSRSDYFLTDSLNNYGEFISTYAVPPIIDAIQSLKVVSHTDSAEFGGVLGGVIDATTKSGTNDLHGSAWEYARNDIFDARSYFLPTTVPKTPYSQNQFGGSIGGPVWIPKLYHGRNKTFFFGAYQGFRFLQTSNTPLHVPTAQELQGNLGDWPTQIYNPFTTRPDPAHPGQYISDPFPFNQIPVGMIQKNLVAYAQFAYPAAGPVFDSSGDNALDTTPLTQTQNEWDIRVDQKIGANDSAFFRYSRLNSTTVSSSGLPNDPSTTLLPNANWGASYTHVFNPSLVLQGQFSHTTMPNTSQNSFTNSTTAIAKTLNFDPAFTTGLVASPNSVLLPSMTIGGYSSNPGDYFNTNELTNSWEYSAGLDKTLGTHALHFGGGFTTMSFASTTAFPIEFFAAQNTADPNPADTVNQGSALASFLLGVPNGYELSNNAVGTRFGGVADGYAQDSWKVTSKLTLNYGLRYDVTFTPPVGKNSLTPFHGGPYIGDWNFTNGTYVLQKLPPSCSATKNIAPCIPGNGTLPAHVVVSPTGKFAYNNYDNFGPRIGFAYRIGEKAVVRGAFGIVYDNWAAVTQTQQNAVGTWPDVGYSAASNLNLPSSTSAKPTITAINPFGTSGAGGLLPAATPYNQLTFFFDPHRRNPRSEQWNIGVEQELNNSTTATLNYVGMVSQRLDVGGYYNTALTPGPGDPQKRSLFPYTIPTLYDRSAGAANYNALQFSLIKRFTDSWSYSVAYTWSKTMNDGTDGWYGSEGGVPQDPYDPAGYGSRAVAGFDITNVLAVSTLYQVPIGKGKGFSTGNSALNYILGNWQINNIFTAHSGTPFTPNISSDIANTGNSGYEHLNVVGKTSGPKTPSEWFNRNAYAVPPGYTYGTAGRNSLRSAGSYDLDTSLFRIIPVGEGRQFEFRLEAFNVLNHPVLGTPNTDYNSGSLFDTINYTASTARELQLALKFAF
ncbi:MAG TPA: carboxypeptidase regulatory-like domain-containing protein [Acidobacteriaceae bacterium]|nr:carboxypeptidase regulatory-like domain-containing protein [Acidobacteriaceae bacterium]